MGVPLYYSLTLFRNKAELHELRNLELSAFTEGKRIELGSRLHGKELREYAPEISEAEVRKAALEERYEARRALLPGALKKLTNGYEMRTYWFEIFECIRKILLILVPIFFPADSPEQLTIGLIICFVRDSALVSQTLLLTSPAALLHLLLTPIHWHASPTSQCTFGAYMMYAPFIDDGDDLLSQICQLQIFFSLLSSIILKTNPNSPAMGVLLPILIGVPPISAFVFESGLLDELAKLSNPEDNGWPIPFTGGKRVGVGCRGKMTRCLECLLGVKSLEVQDEEDEDNEGKEEVTRMQEKLAAEKARSKAAAAQADAYSPGAGEDGLGSMFGSFFGGAPAEAQANRKRKAKQQAEEAKAAQAAEATSMATAVKISSYIVETFQRFDSDGSGSLDYKELRGALKHYGIDCTHPAAADLITRYDERPDGRMQLHEFAELVINVNEGMIRLGSSHPLPAPTKKKPSLATPPLDLSPMLDPVTPSAHALKENASGRPLSPIEQAVAQAVV